MLQIMPGRRVNYEAIVVFVALIIFWVNVVMLVIHISVYAHQHNNHVDQVSTCPRLPSHQQQGPIIT